MSTNTVSASPQVGTTAPDFTLHNDEQDAWQLSAHRDRPAVLLFFPGAFTSVCTSELNTVTNEYNSFGEAYVVGLSTDSPFVLGEFRSVEQIGFPLLSDHDAEVAAQYGAKYENNFAGMPLDRIAKRAAFVVDTEGTIRYAEVLENAGKQPDFEAIQDVLESLRG